MRFPQLSHRYSLVTMGLACSWAAQSAVGDVISFNVDNNLTGNADAQVKITLDDEIDPGNIKITAEVVSPMADLRGLFFHVGDESLVDGLSADGDDVNNTDFDVNDVFSVGAGNNIRGGGDANPGPFDAGIEIGTSGISNDDIASTMLTLSHDTQDLDLSFLLNQPIAVRLMSVGTDAGGRGGSSKIFGTITPDPGPPIPEPTAAFLWLAGLGLTQMVPGRKR